MITSESAGEISLYNVPRELIDPRDPAIIKHHNSEISEKRSNKKIKVQQDISSNPKIHFSLKIPHGINLNSYIISPSVLNKKKTSYGEEQKKCKSY